MQKILKTIMRLNSKIWSGKKVLRGLILRKTIGIIRRSQTEISQTLRQATLQTPTIITRIDHANPNQKRMKSSHKYFLLLVLFFVLVSCDSKQVFDSYKSVGKSWHKDNIVSFEFEATDTIANYNMFLNLRANNDYPFSNIFLITSIESPNST